MSLLGAAVVLTACSRGILPTSDVSSPPHVPDYLGNWKPVRLTDRNNWPAQFVVAQDGSGTHTTVQSAINDLPAAGSGSARHFILIKPGTYRETVCAQNKAPFTLYAKGAPHEVTVVEGRYNALAKPAGVAAHPCFPNLESTTYGTFGSTSVAILSDESHLAGFTIANDAMEHVVNGHGYPAGAGASGGAQAVALSLRGDRIQLSEMRLIGHQDTFFVDKTPSPSGRIFVTDSMIAGDVDFIFGSARLVIDNSLIISRSGRSGPGNGGHVLAPSTSPLEPLGFLVTRSRLLGQPGLAKGSVSLGRPWDHGVKRGEWMAGQSPNGQALIRDSQLGEHLGAWGPSTSGRLPEATGMAAYRTHVFNNERVQTLAPTELP